MKFLKIPIQEEIIHTAREPIARYLVFRGARGGGKTITAVRWAIEHMAQGTDVVFINGAKEGRTHAIYIIERELTKENIPFTRNSRDVVRTSNGARIYFREERHSLSYIIGKALVVDDADYIHTEYYQRIIPLRKFCTGMLITGNYNEWTFHQFLDDANEGIMDYHEISHLEMLAHGITTKQFIDDFKSRFPDEAFTEVFGLWTKRENRYHKGVLETLDD